MLLYINLMCSFIIFRHHYNFSFVWQDIYHNYLVRNMQQNSVPGYGLHFDISLFKANCCTHLCFIFLLDVCFLLMLNTFPQKIKVEEGCIKAGLKKEDTLCYFRWINGVINVASSMRFIQQLSLVVFV